MPLVHAENGDVVARMQEAVLGRGVTGPEGHAYSRPPEVEGEATNRAIMIADMTGTPLYVVHTSCRESHEAIARARAAGKRVYGEPLIQHLLLDATEYENRDWNHAARRVMSPPFRDRVHQDSLWAGLQSGSLQVVATDHCAFTTEQKRLGLDDFRKIPNGTGGLEDRMPLLWTAGVNTGRLTREEFVAVTSSNIARILNIYPRKGRLAAGSDADIVVWDPEATKTITAKSQMSRIDYNVFEGYACTGAPVVTMSRGKVAFAKGDLRAEKGDGRYVERPAFSPVHIANSTWKLHSAPQAVRRRDVTP
jgi:dihydropyrimidinase